MTTNAVLGCVLQRLLIQVGKVITVSIYDKTSGSALEILVGAMHKLDTPENSLQWMDAIMDELGRVAIKATKDWKQVTYL
jgi:hypothetical protein